MREAKPPCNRLWEEELDRVNRALCLVSSTNKSLHQVADVVTWLNHVCRSAVDVRAYQTALVGFANQDDKKSIWIVASAGLDPTYLKSDALTWADEPRGRGPGGTAIRTGRTCIARDIPNDPVFEPWRKDAAKLGYKSSVALPLTSDGRTFGILAMYADVVDAFGPIEVRLLEELADDLAFGLTVVLHSRAERQAANDALVDSRQKLVEAERIAHLGHWERDLKTNILHWSNEAFRIFGLEPQPGGFPLSEFLRHIHAEDRPTIVQRIEEWVQSGRNYDVEYRIVRTDGVERFVHCTGNVVRDDAGQPVRTFGIIQDITERHHAREALEIANKSLEAKNVALREVLASIEAEQGRIGRQINTNVQKIILPQLQSLRQSLNRGQQRRLEQIEVALEEVTSPFIDRAARTVSSLTPMELRICDFVRRGLAVKEIAELEHLSAQTVAAHRRNIRRKLGISNQKVNLASHLQTVFTANEVRNS
ncbi:MAG: GAF domain-containing protein [Tepidisphaeraceae bacterium]